MELFATYTLLFKKRRILFMCLLALGLLLGFQNSLFFPEYQSSAMVLLQPGGNPAKISSPFSDPVFNENFISTQIQILTSYPIFREALKKSFPKLEYSDKQLQKWKQRIKIKREPLTNLITVIHAGQALDELPIFLNHLLESYQKWVQNNLVNDASRIDSFLEREIKSRKKTLESAEKELLCFLKSSQSSGHIEEYLEIVKQMLELQKELDTRSLKQDSLQKEIVALNLLLGETPELLSEHFTNSTMIESLRKDLENNQLAILEAQQYFTEKNSKLAALLEKKDFLKNQIREQIKEIFSSNLTVLEEKGKRLQNQLLDLKIQAISDASYIESLNKMLVQKRKLLNQLNVQESELTQFKTEIFMRRESYSQLVKLRDENLLYVNQQHSPGVRIVHSASVSKQKNTLFKTCFLGLGLGILLCFLILYFDCFYGKHLLSVGQFASFLGVAPLGAVPFLKQKNQIFPNVSESPRHYFEAFRKISLELILKYPNSRSILVTSPNPGSGKSSFSANLGWILAQAGNRVLLVDCDREKFSLFDIFGAQKPDIQPKTKSLHQWYFANTSSPNLTMGSISVFDKSPLEIFNSKQVKNILEEPLKSGKQDFIIWDSLSLKYSYPMVLSTHTDLSLLLFHAGQDLCSDVLDAHKIFSTLNIPYRYVVLQNSN